MNAPLPYPVAYRIARYLANEGYFPAVERPYSRYVHNAVHEWSRICLNTEHCSSDFIVAVSAGGIITGFCDCCPAGGEMFKKELQSLRRNVTKHGVSYIDKLEQNTHPVEASAGKSYAQPLSVPDEYAVPGVHAAVSERRGALGTMPGLRFNLGAVRAPSYLRLVYSV